jgi:glutamine phosphoribosylpyrophosphate amidotransferase
MAIVQRLTCTNYIIRYCWKCDNFAGFVFPRGTVNNVFTPGNILDIPGNVGIGHIRYPTAGGTGDSEAQPISINSPFA